MFVLFVLTCSFQFSALGQQVLPQPPLPPAQEVYIYMTEILREVNGSLTVLSPHHGFRKFVQAKATEIGITGSIQRYHHSDVRIHYEGTASQITRFIAFLNLCRHQGMIGAVDKYSRTRAEERRFDDFLIDRDFSRTVANGGKVLKGAFSNGDERRT